MADTENEFEGKSENIKNDSETEEITETSSPENATLSNDVEVSNSIEKVKENETEENATIADTETEFEEKSEDIKNDSETEEITETSSPENATSSDDVEVSNGIEKVKENETEENATTVGSENISNDVQNNEAVSEEKMKDNVHYEGDVAIYTDPSTNYQYTWCNEKEEWVARSNVTYGFEDDTHTYTDSDGVKYFWDKEKSAWFPKIDDNFMAIYQLNYGFIDNTTEKEKPEIEKPKKEEVVEQFPQALKRKQPPPEPTWFEVDDQHNTNVYVSNLPLDLTEQEFVDLMQKYGLVMREGPSGKMKVKLYTEPNSKIFKGDALCTYIRIESVDLALKLLDGSDVKGNKVKVERAKFQMKGQFDPALKPKKRKKKDKEKLKRMQEKLFDWRPERMRGERAKHEKIVIVKNVFESSMFDTDVGLILEFQQDLREECSKCGDVRKVIIFDRHPEGVAQVNMKEPEEADAVVQLLNGRWFGKRQLTAEIFDGKTKYKIAETDSQISQRIDKWDKFLEGEDDKSENKGKPSEAPKAKSTSKTNEDVLTGTINE